MAQEILRGRKDTLLAHCSYKLGDDSIRQHLSTSSHQRGTVRNIPLGWVISAQEPLPQSD
jgi:hypothetical protein